MGNNSTKPIISYKEALDRCSPQEIEILKSGFKLYAVKPDINDRKSSQNIESKEQLLRDKHFEKRRIDKFSFAQDIMGTSFPKQMAERIFTSFDSSGSGKLAYKDFICGMVIFLKGTVEEKSQLLAKIFDMKGKGNVSREDMTLILLEDVFDKDIDLQDIVDEAFKNASIENSGRLTYDELLDWANKNKQLTALTSWLYEKPKVLDPSTLSALPATPSKSSSKVDTTIPPETPRVVNISNKSIDSLITAHKWLIHNGTSYGYINRRHLTTAFADLPPLFIDRIFKLFSNMYDEASIKDIVVSLSSCWGSADINDKMKFCFNVFDTDFDGSITRDQLTSMFKSLWKINELSNTFSSPKKKKDEKSKKKSTTTTTTTTDDTSSETEKAINRLVEQAFAKRKTRKDDRDDDDDENSESSSDGDDEDEDGHNHHDDKDSKTKIQKINLNDFLDFIATNKVAIEFNQTILQLANHYLGIKPESKKEEKKIIERFLEEYKSNPLQKNSRSYVVSEKWFKEWKEHVNSNEDSEESDETKHEMSKLVLGPIDNKSLLREGSKLSIKKENQSDYIVISENAWNAFYSWYGAEVILPRSTIEVGDDEVEVELYPFEIKFILKQSGLKQQPRPVNVLLSAQDTLSRALKVGSTLFSTVPSNTDAVRLWDASRRSKPVLFEDMTMTLSESGVSDESVLFIEVRNANGYWPLDKAQSSLKSMRMSRVAPGLVGLSNLGNTCYMNSAIQCMSNVPQIAHYFASQKYKTEINKKNPIGKHGDIASQFGKLMEKIWTDKETSSFCTPLELKMKISNHEPIFSGFRQHDSQELLNFLLDSLHEDLNRVTDKPYFPGVETDGKTEKEVAEETWSQHKLRNDSIIADLFHGLLKSTVTCDKCGHVSLKFEPFTFLNLPIPINKIKYLLVTLYKIDGSIPVQYGITLDESSTIKDVKTEISKLSGLSVDSMVMVEVSSGCITKLLPDARDLTGLPHHDLRIYQVGGLSRKYLKDNALVTKEKQNENEYIRQKKNLEYKKKEFQSNPGELLDDLVDPSSKIKEKNLQKEREERKKNGKASKSKKDDVDSDSEGVEVNNEDKESKSRSEDQKETTDEVDKVKDVDTAKSPRKQKEKVSSPRNKRDKDIKDSNGEDHSLVDEDEEEEEEEEKKKKNNKKRGGGGKKNKKLQKTKKKASMAKLIDDPHWEFIYASHRVLEKLDIYFLSPYKPKVFGIPLILSYYTTGSNNNTFTNTDMYKLVWSQIKKFVTITDLPPTSEGHPWDKVKDKLPYKLDIVNKYGTSCGICNWNKMCCGCTIPKDDDIFKLKDQQTIAITWSKDDFSDTFSEGKTREIVLHKTVHELRTKEKEAISINSCLNDFTSPERLEGDNLWYCSDCKEFQPSVKKIDLWRLPPVMIIHLKRFEHKQVGNATTTIKIDRLVDFPLKDFDLSGFSASDEKQSPYDLLSSLNHFGSLTHGHYTAYANYIGDNKWYCFDDTRCSPIENEKIITSNSAYLLFYAKQSEIESQKVPDYELGDNSKCKIM
eukprot:TRINITY_DN466_c6_g1_i1.p1 TRINITY_DN466_c6_g1~~TRINITY_DN466_c6_g1_i1.p1  ORF type:complete len:1521 (-),score=405.16 TRINITY_DN466_c6_g1_i1:30-4592(-)